MSLGDDGRWNNDGVKVRENDREKMRKYFQVSKFKAQLTSSGISYVP